MSENKPFDDLARQFLNKESDLIRKTPSLFEELQLKKRYSEKKFWAEGGMKRIFQVYDHSTGRHMAMAELKPDLGKEYIKAFLREARLTAALDHPNIVSIHEIGFHKDKRPFFTMDFFSNRTLANLLEDHQQYSLRDRLDIFIKVCDAIAYAHSKGVLHLDIKGPNIHIGKYGEVWLSDWGLGKSLEEHDPNESSLMGLEDIESLNHLWTNHQGIKGTPGNIAPEQIESYDYANKLSDVYALGCLLYEMCTLQKPFSGDPKHILQQTLKGLWAEPRQPNKQALPKSLIAVIKKSMALDQDDRYQSVQELKKDLELFLHGYSTQAENAGIMKQLGLFIWRYRLASIVAFFASITLLITSYVFIRELSRSNKSAQEAADFAYTQTQRIAQIAADKDAERLKLVKDNLKASLQLIGSHLQSLNPAWDGKELVFDEPSKILKVTSPKISTLFQNRKPFQMCLLKFLDFESLSIYGSGILDLNELSGLSFYSLDIRNTKITSLAPLQNFKISVLRLDKEQFSEKEFNSIPKNIKLILQ